MENETKVKKNNSLAVSIVVGALILAGAWIYTNGLSAKSNSVGIKSPSAIAADQLEAVVLPSGGVTLPVRWNDLGAKMVEAGVIDLAKLDTLYAERGGVPAEMRQLLTSENNDQLKITPENAGMMLNLLWALGLGNKNAILDTGPMSDPKYGGAGNFASTGGWSLASGQAMDHYSGHAFMVLTPAQQQLVERVSKNIYRPCCGNATHFPDCNHGMAMLGLLELMATQGVSEEKMYQMALAVNSYWFPDTYMTMAEYMKNQGVAWAKVDPREMLGVDYSSGPGYQKIQSQVVTPTQKGGGGCSV